MKGGLVVSPAWWLSPPGIAVAYERALRLTRRIYVSAACQAAHPDGMLALRRLIALGRCETAGSKCQLERNWETFQGRASHRRTSHGQREYIALVTPKVMNEEPYSTLPRVCRQTFGAFARGMTRIIPSRGPRLAGREVTTPGSVPSEDPGGAWSPKPASPKRKCIHVPVAKIPWFDRLRSRIAHAHHVHIFVLVVLISVTPWPLRLLTTTISMHRLRGLVRSIRSLVLAATGLLQTPANSRGWCAAHLRLSRRSSDGAPRIFCFVIGKLLLPAAMAEPRAAAQTN